MILIAKDAFFEPKKFFYENPLRPSFTYDDIIDPINDPIFHKVQKTPFLAVFWPKFALKKFFPKIGLRHIRGFIVIHLFAKIRKIK